MSVNYPQPVPRMKYYRKKYGYIDKNEFKNAELISDKSISLPLGPHLTKKLDYIVKSLKEFLV